MYPHSVFKQVQFDTYSAIPVHVYVLLRNKIQVLFRVHVIKLYAPKLVPIFYLVIKHEYKCLIS